MPLSLEAAHRLTRSTSDEQRPRGLGILSAPLSPRTLTPAGAVAAAYKEQEKRRRDSVSVTTTTNGQPHRDSYDENGGAYYTVFGSSGTVVAVGAPEDERWAHYDLSNYTSNKSKNVSQKPSLGTLGRLSRKSSTKVKKIGTGSGIVSESEHGHEGVTRDEEVRRASLQGRRSTSLPGKRRNKKPPITPIDSDFGVMSDSPQSAVTPSKSAGWPSDDHSPSTSGKIWKLMKRISTGGLRDKYNAQEDAPPVPALPEGLLLTPPKLSPMTRTAPQSLGDSKPPISRYVRGRSSFGDAPFSNRRRDIQGAPGLVSSHQPPTPSSGKNPSHRRRSTNTRSSSPVSSDKASSRYWQKSRSSSVSTFEEMPPLPKRIMTSGHILSPTELCRLEKEQAMSASLSSPPSTVDSHSPTASSSNHRVNTVIVIRKPSLKGVHLRANGEDSETDGVSASDFTALPTPPRHHYRSNPHVIYHQQNDSSTAVGSVSSSPTIPMFSNQDVVNQFHLTKGSGGDTPGSLNSSLSRSIGASSNESGVVVAVQPPPRPKRSSKRKPLVMSQHVVTRASEDHGRDSRDSHRSKEVFPPMSSSYPRERTLDASSKLGDHSGGGRSCGTFGSYQSMGLVELVKTSQDSCSSRENVTPSSSIHSRSPLKFRELGTGEEPKERKVWTEKEKAERWDDLLEESDRVGGTIHIGNPKLLSDTLRFSDYSTLTTSAL